MGRSAQYLLVAIPLNINMLPEAQSIFGFGISIAA
jgi:hypothetical protein